MKSAQIHPLKNAKSQEAEAVASASLGAIEREICVSQQRIYTHAVLGREHNTDADPDCYAAACDRVGLADALQDPRCEPFRTVGAAEVGLQHDEFVAANSRDRIDRAYAAI